jgi:predicted ABC-type ATPase
MEGEFIQMKNRLPEVIVFAGPNGSGKTTITRMAKTIGIYINADDIKKSSLCSDLEAALKAEELRESMVEQGKDFTFETVLSTDRNLKLLKKAKEKGYFLRCIYVLTSNPEINKTRIDIRESMGGHTVPEEKIKSRYYKALDLVPELVEICDIVHIYDNTNVPFRISRKERTYISIGKTNIGIIQTLKSSLELVNTLIKMIYFLYFHVLKLYCQS